jgi:hypothetical protein
MIKQLLVPARVRRIPRQFSWVDQRLVRDRWVERCDARALALYLLLVTVSDAQGLSYYGDAALQRLLGMSSVELAAARRGLIQADLVAYQPPLYQVLDLPARVPLDARSPPGHHAVAAHRSTPTGELRSIRELLGMCHD